MQNIPNNKIKISTLSTIERREALKQLKDLGILGLGMLVGLQQGIRQENLAISLQDFIANLANTNTITHSIFTSNIPKEILSLPLKHFSIPHEYANILQAHKKQGKDLKFIIPLATNKYLDYTHYYLNMPFKHTNLPFLSYHYDTLQSFLKDVETQGFYMRNYIIDSINMQIIKEFFILLGQDDKRQALYNEYKHKEAKGIEAIDAYHIAMNYLDDVYMDCFNTNLKDNTPNLKKHREFLRALNVIGENNIRALYVGIGEEAKEENFDRRTASKHNKKTDNDSEKNKDKRPKFIGRLATTIVMKDGLWIG